MKVGISDPKVEVRAGLLGGEQQLLIQQEQPFQRRAILEVHPDVVSDGQTLLVRKGFDLASSFLTPCLQGVPGRG